jgi:transcription termination/antitermination protein NusG
MPMKWFVVHTYSGFEQKVRADIQDALKRDCSALAELFGEIIVPMEPPVPEGEKKRPGGRRKFFPGYILVQMELNDETHHFIRHRANVTGFLGNERGPRPLPEKDVERIRGQMEQGPIRPVAEAQFEEGTNVRIKDGPFVNFSGIIEEVKSEKRKVRVLVTIFGRATPVELDFGQVERQ